MSYFYLSSNLTNKYNPQELALLTFSIPLGSNLTNKYNPQELQADIVYNIIGSNLTNKYNPQELRASDRKVSSVQILPINTILKNKRQQLHGSKLVQILPINTILKNA